MEYSPDMYTELKKRKQKERSSLKIAIILTGTFMALEITGGIVGNSLALFSDAFHMFSDFISYSIALFALVFVMNRKPDSKMTFGYWRWEVITSFINTIFLMGVSVYIFYESYLRIVTPVRPDEFIVIPIAIAGLFINLVVFRLLSKLKSKNTNIKAVVLHTMGDTLGSFGVIIGGVIIIFTGMDVVDTIVAVGIGASILILSIRLLLQNLRILTEGIPKDIDIDLVKNKIKDFKEVKDIHDLHVWQLTGEIYMLSAHIRVDDFLLSTVDVLREKITSMLFKEFNIEHVNLQFECKSQCMVNL